MEEVYGFHKSHIAMSLLCHNNKSLCCVYLEVREEGTREIYRLVSEPATRYIFVPDHCVLPFRAKGLDKNRAPGTGATSSHCQCQNCIYFGEDRILG